MFQGLFDSHAAFDLTMKTFAPVTRASELSAKAFEKLARFSSRAPLTWSTMATAPTSSHGAGHGPLELAARHTELTAKFVESRSVQWQEFLKFTSELQGDVTKWAEDAKAQMAASSARPPDSFRSRRYSGRRLNGPPPILFCPVTRYAQGD